MRRFSTLFLFPLLLSAASNTYLYRCGDGLRFTARFDNGRVWLFLPRKSVALPFIDARVGGKKVYRDGSTVFIFEGERAVLEENGRLHGNCRNDRRGAIWEKAKLDGVDFRAVGNEPPWILEIRGDRLDFFYGYDKKRCRFKAKPQVDRHKRQTRYVAVSKGSSLEVILRPGPCHDSMSDETYETRVEIRWSGRRLTGCGTALH
ncbi:hypothetical protein [Hydrogenimonas urashimensis]|uniref:hypothetical protein n=1 Tax=Hydrogenimonas urashimensis TaxID=2740515 RepID=UPI001915C796|nr:hypothetical protein [Hydrogenimonas urashimensis]